MGSRYEVEVKLSSASNLKNVNWRHGQNRPYAVVWVDPSQKCSTNADQAGDTKAEWDQTLIIALPPGPIEDFTLFVDVVHAGSEPETKPLIGSAQLRLSDVRNDVGIGERSSRTLKLKRPSGRPQGTVDVRVAIRDTGYRPRAAYDAPPYGVPPPPPQDFSAAPAGYPSPYSAPPATGYSAAPATGYSAAPATGYGAAPATGYGAAPATGYGAAPVTGYSAPAGTGYGGYGAQPATGYGATAPYGQQSYGQGVSGEKKSKFGGMGAGLAVGALAGGIGALALGKGVDYLEDKIADRAAEKVEDDLGFDDF